MVYAVKADNLFRRTVEIFDDENDSTNSGNLKALENGEWKFYGLAYTADSGATTDSAGLALNSKTLYCGIANDGNAITLSGGDETVNIVFSPVSSSTGKCSNAVFGPDEYRSSDLLQGFQLDLCTQSQFDTCKETASTADCGTCNATLDANERVLFGYGAYNIEGVTLDIDTLDLTSITTASFITGCTKSYISSGGTAVLPLGNSTVDSGLTPFTFFMALATDVSDCQNIPAAPSFNSSTQVVFAGGIDSPFNTISSKVVIKKVSEVSALSINKIYFNTGK
jgi:hypothetical protein